MKKYCITGGAGFIGSHVAEAYLATGAEVVCLDDLSSGKRENVPEGARFVELDIRDADALSEFFKVERFDVVNHHAAQISVPDSVKDPRHDADINIKGLLTTLEACRAAEVEKFIFISSGGTVYGDPDTYPCEETYPFSPVNPYGISKAAGELYVRHYGIEHGLRWTALRYSNVYGPRQDPHGEAGVVAIFSQRLLKDEPVTVFGAREAGDGGCSRDYVFVKDVAQANVAVLAAGDGEAFNIGTGVQTTTQGLIDRFAGILGRKLAVKQGPPRPGDLLANNLSYAKAEKLLDWRPSADLASGIKATIDFFAS